MQITCPECLFARDIPDGKVPPNATLATCPKCKAKFNFRSPAASPAQPDPFAGNDEEPRLSRRRLEPPTDPRPARLEADQPRFQASRPEEDQIRAEPPRPKADRFPAEPSPYADDSSLTSRLDPEDDPAEPALAALERFAAEEAAPAGVTDAELQPLRRSLARRSPLSETHARMGEDLLDYAIAEERARSVAPRPLSSRRPVSPEDADAIMGGPPTAPITPPAAYARELAAAGLMELPAESFRHLEALADAAPFPPMGGTVDRRAGSESAGQGDLPTANRFLTAFDDRRDQAPADAPPRQGWRDAVRNVASGGFLGRTFKAVTGGKDGAPAAPSGEPEAEAARPARAQASARPAARAGLDDLAIPGLSARPAAPLTEGWTDDPAPDPAARWSDGAPGLPAAGLADSPAPAASEKGLDVSGLFKGASVKTLAETPRAARGSLTLPGQSSFEAALADETESVPAGGADAQDDPLAIPGLDRPPLDITSGFLSSPANLDIPGLGRPARSSSLDDDDLAIPGLNQSATHRPPSRPDDGFAIPGVSSAGFGAAQDADPDARLSGAADPTPPSPAFLARLLGRSAVPGGQTRDLWQDLENLGGRGDEPGADGAAKGEPAPWEHPGRRGLLGGFFRTMVSAMLSPSRFFSRLSLDGGLGRPLAYVALLAEILALAHFLLDYLGISTGALIGVAPQALPFGNMLDAAWSGFALYPLLGLGGLLIMAMYRHGLLTLVGSAQGGFSGVVRVLAYGSSPLVLLAAPLLGLPLALPWFIAVTVVGFKRVNRTNYARVMVACVLPDVLVLLISLYAALNAGVIP